MGDYNELPAGMSMTEEQQSMPLRDAVFVTLRKAILTGRLKPDERLTEIKLGKLLGTSRTPIREAIRKLELEGLVTIVPGSGARVSRMTLADLEEVMQIRRALEQLSAELASKRITPEEAKELRAACDVFEKAIEAGDTPTITEADAEIHDAIMRASGNSKLVKMLGSLADNIYRYRYEFIRDDGHFDQLIREHRELCSAIIIHNTEKATEVSRRHIENTWLFIKARILDGGEE